MNKQMQKITLMFTKMNFDRKIKLLLTASVVIISVTVLVSSILFTIMMLTQKSSALATQQIESLSKNLEFNLGDYKDVFGLLMHNKDVQRYLKLDRMTAEDQKNSQQYIAESVLVSNAVTENMKYVLNAKSSIYSITVIRASDFQLRSSGSGLINSFGASQLNEDYQNAHPVKVGNMRFSMYRTNNQEPSYKLNLYRPVNNIYNMEQELGLLCMSVEESFLQKICSSQDGSMDFHIRITDSNGVILSDADIEMTGEKEAFADKLRGEGGTFTDGGKMVFYREIGDWNMYLIGTISFRSLLAESYIAVALILVLILVLVIVSLVLCTRLLQRIYKPLQEIKDNMLKVASGNLHVQVGDERMGKDFQEMVQSFNTMVVQLDKQMLQIKEEQHQIRQITLNALQSQIKPHFLYNTLDCIHWQALLDGNQKISRLVKALANYYRLCLSKGQDVIPLSQEILHIENYLLIQNMRYGDIIQIDLAVKPEFERVLIPKMTLQPLIENCIYHGIKVKEGVNGVIEIRAGMQDGDVVVCISDSGTGMSQSKINEINASISIHDESFGYGVRNVHKRIEILFGKGYGLLYRKNDNSGITVEIRLPAEYQE